MDSHYYNLSPDATLPTSTTMWAFAALVSAIVVIAVVARTAVTTLLSVRRSTAKQNQENQGWEQ